MIKTFHAFIQLKAILLNKIAYPFIIRVMICKVLKIINQLIVIIQILFLNQVLQLYLNFKYVQNLNPLKYIIHLLLILYQIKLLLHYSYIVFLFNLPHSNPIQLNLLINIPKNYIQSLNLCSVILSNQTIHFLLILFMELRLVQNQYLLGSDPL